MTINFSSEVIYFISSGNCFLEPSKKMLLSLGYKIHSLKLAELTLTNLDERPAVIIIVSEKKEDYLNSLKEIKKEPVFSSNPIIHFINFKLNEAPAFDESRPEFLLYSPFDPSIFSETVKTCFEIKKALSNRLLHIEQLKTLDQAIEQKIREVNKNVKNRFRLSELKKIPNFNEIPVRTNTNVSTNTSNDSNIQFTCFEKHHIPSETHLNSPSHDTKAQELEQAVSVRDEIIGMLGHELRTPLTSLIIQLQLMERTVSRQPNKTLSAEQLNHFLPQAIKQSVRLSSMLDRLLDLSRIRSKRFHLEITTINLKELISDIVLRLTPYANNSGSLIEFSSDVDEGFSYVDPIRIEQVMYNLISNAIKYGLGKPIHVQLSINENLATIEVRDQGCGISESDQNRIFNKYERASETEKSQSLGLGLYISQEIVNAHGGVIEIDSKTNIGSTFRIKIPTKRLT